MTMYDLDSRQPVKTLLIDNFDSFTYNLYQLLSVVNGIPPYVIYNDAFDGDWERVCLAFRDIDNIVISPGPGTPENPADFGFSACAFNKGIIPVLGICLGHQGLGYVCGAKIKEAPEIVHGRCTRIEFSEKSCLFGGFRWSADVARYHSLCIDPQSLPECLFVTAWTNSPSFTIMGVQHREQPFFGIQFHPESVGTTCGEKILRNFKTFTHQWRRMIHESFPPDLRPIRPRPSTPVTPQINGAAKTRKSHAVVWEVNICEVLSCCATWGNEKGEPAVHPPQLDSTQLFKRLYSNSPTCFWLDSSSADPSLAASGRVQPEPLSRFSFMGDAQGPCAFALESWSDSNTCQIFRCPHGCPCAKPQKLHSRELPVDPFDALRLDGVLMGGQESLRFRHWRGVLTPGEGRSKASKLESVECDAASAKPPFDFLGGFVGFFAYELYHRAFARLRAAQGLQPPMALAAHGMGCPPRHPLSLWMFADRFVAVDNHTGRCFVVWLTPCMQDKGGPLASSGAPKAEGGVAPYPECEPLLCALHGGRLSEDACKFIAETQELWALATLRHIAAIRTNNPIVLADFREAVLAHWAPRIPPLRLTSESREATGPVPEFRSALTEEKYKAAIKKILEEIKKGNAYEVCLTDQMTAKYIPRIWPPLNLYLSLRARNPSKFGAFLKYDWGGQFSVSLAAKKDVREEEGSSPAIALCCASPELFLKVEPEGWVESRPIKGTRRRGRTPEEDAALAAELAASEKDKAENMMIVDLVRNDLGRVCLEGSISVPHFLTVETYPAVHHMVSVVRGKLKVEEYDAIDAVIAAFPGGSMTGAPKISAMNIINKCEAGPRGVYSGTIGFLSVGGAACLNIVIRTAVMDANEVSVGAGGAIINLSDEDEEYKEMQLKAASVKISFGYV